MPRFPLLALCASLALSLCAPEAALAASKAAKPAPHASAKAGAKAAPGQRLAKARAPASKRSARSVKKLRLAAAGALAAAPLSAGSSMGLGALRDALGLQSNAALVMDASAPGGALFEKNAGARLPIASITKLMTALVALDARPSLSETLSIEEADVDRVKRSSSRLSVGARLSRDEMLRLALMSSENRAAHALSRHYPGGTAAFVAAMNAKAKSLGMADTRYVDPTGLSPENVSTARDLGKLILAAQANPLIAAYSTAPARDVMVGSRKLAYLNTNRLVRDASQGWRIGLQKTGYIMEAGRCLVMQALIEGRPIVMVFLDSKGKLDRFDDAQRVRQWLAARKAAAPQTASIALDRPLY